MIVKFFLVNIIFSLDKHIKYLNKQLIKNLKRLISN